ncbi:MAG: copper chaperone PCu(A)C, partial [Pseudomonadales bacterium]
QIITAAILRSLSLMGLMCLVIGAGRQASADAHESGHPAIHERHEVQPRAAHQGSRLLKATELWARAPLPGRNVMAIYGKLTSEGGITTLKGASSPAAGRMMLHETSMIDGQMRMQHKPWPELSSDVILEMKPGSAHLMAMELRHPLKAGDRLTLQIETVEGQTYDYSVPVQSATALEYEPEPLD